MNTMTEIYIVSFIFLVFFLAAAYRGLKIIGTVYENWAIPRRHIATLKVEILKAKLKDLQDREVRRNIKWRKGVNLEDF